VQVLNPRRPVIFIDTGLYIIFLYTLYPLVHCKWDCLHYFFIVDKLPALEARDQKIVNNPIEAQIIAEVGHFQRWYIISFDKQIDMFFSALCWVKKYTWTLYWLTIFFSLLLFWLTRIINTLECFGTKTILGNYVKW